jgi:hypothetical protein
VHLAVGDESHVLVALHGWVDGEAIFQGLLAEKPRHEKEVVVRCFIGGQGVGGRWPARRGWLAPALRSRLKLAVITVQLFGAHAGQVLGVGGYERDVHVDILIFSENPRGWRGPPVNRLRVDGEEEEDDHQPDDRIANDVAVHGT